MTSTGIHSNKGSVGLGECEGFSSIHIDSFSDDIRSLVSLDGFTDMLISG